MYTLQEEIRLIVIDIDGTLLNPKGQITPNTLETVRAAQEAGIVVTLATARRYCNTIPVARELGLEIPLILYDGAMIIRHPDALILHQQTLNSAVSQQAVDLFVRHGVQPVVHPDLGMVEEIWTGPAELDNLWLDAYFATYPEQMRRMPHDSLCTGHPDPLRVVAFTSEEAIEGIIPEVAHLECSWNAIKRGSYGSAEMVIMTPGCSKASGVAALASSLNIPLEQVMALGDNNNDIEMLQLVGLGVAMGQAPVRVKAAAKTVTASNAEDGVAQAIAYYALRSAISIASNSQSRSICL